MRNQKYLDKSIERVREAADKLAYANLALDKAVRLLSPPRRQPAHDRQWHVAGAATPVPKEDDDLLPTQEETLLSISNEDLADLPESERDAWDKQRTEMVQLLAQSKEAAKQAAEEQEKVQKSAAMLLNTIMHKVPAEAKDMAGKRRRAADLDPADAPAQQPPAGNEAEPTTAAAKAAAAVTFTSGAADPKDKAALLGKGGGKRSADGALAAAPEDEDAAKLALLSKPDAQTQEETDTKAIVKHVIGVAADLATARLNKIVLAGVSPSEG